MKAPSKKYSASLLYAAIKAQYKGNAYDAVVLEIDSAQKAGRHFRVWFEQDRKYAWLRSSEVTPLPTAQSNGKVKALLPAEFAIDSEVKAQDVSSSHDGFRRAYIRDAVKAVNSAQVPLLICYLSRLSCCLSVYLTRLPLN